MMFNMFSMHNIVSVIFFSPGIAEKIASKVPGTSMFLFGHADVPKKRGLVRRRKEVKWYQGVQGSATYDMYDVGCPPSKRYGLTGTSFR